MRSPAPQPTAFFGRGADMERLEGWIVEGRRVLTLLGPGGAGKTRLAHELARRWNGEVVFCDLTEARDRDGVIIAVGHAIDASLAGDNTFERVARTVAGKARLLLVLDNCEQVIEAAALLVARIAEVAPEAIQLVTSREQLRVPGEQVHHIASLEVEPNLSSDAIRLFVDRARSVEPSFAPTEGDAAVIADIAKRLDGLPLAIELAAARMGVLGLGEIRERLERRFQLLASGPRFAVERQRTLRGAIDWSWELLAPEEQRVLAQCAVFRGGFTLDAAQAVAQLEDHAALDVLQSLSEKSLLFASVGPGERRYKLYESVRAYALETLHEGGQEAAVLDRHAQHFSKPEAKLIELENLLAAHRHAIATKAANSAFTLLRPISELLKYRGPLDLMLSLLDATLVPELEKRAEPSLVGAALRDRALARHFAPETAALKIADLSRALEIARASKDVPLEVSCSSVFASVELLHGHPDAARVHARLAIDRARSLGDKRMLAKAHSDLGACDLAVGKLEEARASLHEAIELSRPIGDRVETARYLARMSETLLQLDRLDEARDSIDEAEELVRPLQQNRLLALIHGVRGTIAYEQEDLERARVDFEASLAFAKSAGAELLEPFYRATRGAVLADAGDIEGARADIEAAEALAPKFADDPIVSVVVSISRGHLDLALARECEREGRTEQSLVHRTDAEKRLDVLDGARDFEDVRIMRKRLERTLARAAHDIPLVATDSAHEGALVVAEDGAWFRLPTGKSIDLSHRPNLQRLLVALVRHRIGASGEPMSLQAIFRNGWPGERADESSAGNRARVALARLRKIGLGDLLVTKGGYLLDPDVPVSVARRKAM